MRHDVCFRVAWPEEPPNYHALALDVPEHPCRMGDWTPRVAAGDPAIAAEIAELRKFVSGR